MGNNNSSGNVKEQKAQLRADLAVADNKFRKVQFSDDNGPNLARAMTFDDRKLLSASTRKKMVGPGMKRSVTFVNKVRVQAPPPATLNDVKFRKHFGHEDAPASEREILPVEFIPPAEQVVPQRQHAVVVVDTFSTGFMLAYQAFVSGYQVISVFSADLGDLASLVPEGLDFSFLGSCTLDGSMGESLGIEKLIAEIQNFGVPVDAVFAGAETGVELADELATRMGLRTNGTEQSEARRNKFLMGETVRDAGVRAVKQLIASTWSEIDEFIAAWQPSPFKVIVKPNDSAGSDDVTLCLSIEDVQKAFGHIIGKVNGLGLVNKAVLVQEYLEGTEYVIDMVSKDGDHKLIGVWEYDRRPANGAGFVCHGQKTLLSTDERVPQMLAYQKKVVTALGVKHGPTHGEMKWFNDSPCLVEVGARCHGGEGIWVGVANEAYGYNQVNAYVDSYLNESAWNAIPEEVRLHCYYHLQPVVS
jgi:predicted ATP-grasp superfamily ATP-dependent carboligase